MLNKIILSLGSNQDQEKNMAEAVRILRNQFVSIAFSNSVYTEPIGLTGSAPFLNRVAVAYTSEQPDEIKHLLKRIKYKLQRMPDDKNFGIVPIDIDLLQWNELILKPDDLRRYYIIEGIRALENEEFKQMK